MWVKTIDGDAVNLKYYAGLIVTDYTGVCQVIAKPPAMVVQSPSIVIFEGTKERCYALVNDLTAAMNAREVLVT